MGGLLSWFDVCWLVGCFVSLLAEWFALWKLCWLIIWLVGLLVSGLVHWLVGCLVGWLDDLSVYWMGLVGKLVC